jgi:dihydroneopterin aldolase
MNPALLDALIVGAGPAGCSAASWLAQLGLRTVVLERAAQPCPMLQQLDIEQDWVLGEPSSTLRALGGHYAEHLQALPGVDLRLNRSLDAVRCLDTGGWALESGGERFTARCLVLATGVRPRRPAAYFDRPDLPDTAGRVLDAMALTSRRAQLTPGSRVLLLGGGDNAVENALYLHARGHAVTLCTRSALRAQPALMARLQAAHGIVLREGEAVPELVAADAQGVTVASALAGTERYEFLSVLFGYEPEPTAFQRVRDAMREQGLPCPALDHSSWQLPEAAPAGLFIAGDASGRSHPCVQTALADGVWVAKQVQQRVKRTLTPEKARALMTPQAVSGRGQILRLTGLRLNGRLGWLDREKHGPQPIQVDAELNMGQQPLMPDDDDLAHVLDYRKVRQIIIDECSAEHSHLIETLLGKLCLRLSRLPGVIGVRVQVTKLEIFDDCHVAMSAEHGQW